MPNENSTFAMGWLPDYPDFRDYSPDHDQISSRAKQAGQKDTIKEMSHKLGVTKTPVELPASVDLRKWCSPVSNQSPLGSCTAHAAESLIEYFENRAFGTYTDISRLFLYKVTRDLLGWTGDTGAFVRTTMGAMAFFGVPPEKYWKYDAAKFDVEPSAFLYSFAQNYQAIQYARLDKSGLSRPQLLERIKTYLAAGWPSMFGFTVYNSISQASSTGKIPFPMANETILGGHAVAVVGFDNNIKIKNAAAGASETTGAFLIKNSWGPSWGPNGGYLWLPYEYVLKNLASDWWTLFRNEWVESKQFGL